MARQPLTIADHYFNSKIALETYTRSILHSYRAPARLKPEDERFISELLQRHEHADEKIGTGIKEIWVKCLAFNSNGFVVKRTDSTEIDFSYKSCLRPSTYASKVKFALRRAVDEQILAIKRCTFPERTSTIVCPITGQVITANKAHVDHIPPATFKNLVETYLELRHITVDDIPLLPTPDGIGDMLPDDWSTDWSLWHQSHAQLRVISEYANLHIVKG
jgi:hypothetical protein